MLSHGCWLILSTIEFHKNEITWGRTHNICLDFSRSSKIASWLNYRGQKIEEMRCFALTRMQQTKIYKYKNCILRMGKNLLCRSDGRWICRGPVGLKLDLDKMWENLDCVELGDILKSFGMGLGRTVYKKWTKIMCRTVCHICVAFNKSIN